MIKIAIALAIIVSGAAFANPPCGDQINVNGVTLCWDDGNRVYGSPCGLYASQGLDVCAYPFTGQSFAVTDSFTGFSARFCAIGDVFVKLEGDNFVASLQTDCGSF